MNLFLNPFIANLDMLESEDETFKLYTLSYNQNIDLVLVTP